MWEVCSAARLRDSTIFAAPKPNSEDVRPIVMVGTLRKLVAKLVMRDPLHQPYLLDTFGHTQLALQPNGAETIIHATRAVFETQPTYDVYSMDGTNAFNSANKNVGLAQMKLKYPKLARMVLALYGTAATLWYQGPDHTIHPVSAPTGFQQGDPLATLLFATTIQPLINRVSASLGAAGLLQFFVDDGHLSAPFPVMTRAIKLILEQGPTYGYHLNLGKGTYMMARCDTDLEAHQRYHTLLQLGFDSSVIRIHPDNLPPNNGPASATESKHADDPLLSTDDYLNTFNCSNLTDYAQHYGLKILGSFIGTNESIQAGLDKKISQLQRAKDLIIAIQHPQIRFILLKWCYRPKLHYWLRTLPPRHMETTIRQFDEYKRDIVNSIVNPNNTDPLPDSRWVQCRLRTRLGGLGLDTLTDEQHAAHVASILDSIGILRRLIPTYDQQLRQPQLPFAQDYAASEQKIIAARNRNESSLLNYEPTNDDSDDYFHATSSRQRQFSRDLQQTAHERFLTFIARRQVHYASWLRSIQDDNGPRTGVPSRWVEVLPRNPHFAFSPFEFTAAMCFRLHLNQPSITPGRVCDCARHKPIDRTGFHSTTGCNKSGAWTRTHDALCLHITQFAKYNGIRTQLEENNCFIDMDRDNRQRPDISILPGHINHIKTILDISHVATLKPNANPPPTRPLPRGHAANIAHKGKLQKYRNIMANCNLEFLPIIFESSGYIHPAALHLFMRLCKTAAETRRISQSILYNYLISSINCVQQKALASALQQSNLRLNSDGVRTNPSTQHYSHENLLDASIIHV